MTQLLRRMVFILLAPIGLLSGCASDACKFLVYEDETPQMTRPLVIPEGVAAPTDTGAFQVPAQPAQAPKGCVARPPQTLPEQAARAEG